MKVTYANAIGDALKEEMRRDGKVLIYGEDIAQFGNIFGITRGMLEEFGPKRVRNTQMCIRDSTQGISVISSSSPAEAAAGAGAFFRASR